MECGRGAAGKDKNMLCFMESKVFFKSNLLLKRESRPLKKKSLPVEKGIPCQGYNICSREVTLKWAVCVLHVIWG